ncbi:Hpt domain-containing protein, partial [Salmonella enterica]|nr:Hpt domain-containing protein [Salmonella enterica]
MDALAEIRQTFFQECDEQLVELEAGLLAVEGGDRDPEVINAAFRAVHSVKGGAGSFNLVDLVRFAHAFENVMDLVRVGRLEPAPALVRLMLRATDVLSDLLRAARADAPHDAARADAVTAELAAACAGPVPPSPAAPAGDAMPVFAPIPVDLDAFDDLGGSDGAVPSGTERFLISFRPRAELFAKGNEVTVLMR